MQSAWVNATGGFVSFPDTKGGAQVRAIGPAALKVIQSQAEIVGNPHVFPSEAGSGPYTAVSSCLDRVCKLAGISGVTPHTLRPEAGRVGKECASTCRSRGSLDNQKKKKKK